MPQIKRTADKNGVALGFRLADDVARLAAEVAKLRVEVAELRRRLDAREDPLAGLSAPPPGRRPEDIPF